MDEDTIEIQSFLIKDNVIYTFLIIYFLFFLLFFICIVKFKSIKQFCSNRNKKRYILPVQSTNLKPQTGKHYYERYKYTKFKTPSEYSTTDLSDSSEFKNKDSTFIPSYGQQNIKRPIIQPLSSPTTSQLNESEKDLITFQSQSPKNSYSSLEQFNKRTKCGFKFKNRKCSLKDCKKKHLLSKIFCKYYSKLKPVSIERSPTDNVQRFNFDKDDTIRSPTEELDREKTLKCYQDFLENRFCKPNGLGNNKENEKFKKYDVKDELKKITETAINNAKILTPKQLRKYEPFKAEIAKPVIKPKLVGKDLSKEFNDQKKFDDDIEYCSFTDLTKNSTSSEDEDYNSLRKERDLKKSKNDKFSRNEKELKSPKIHLESITEIGSKNEKSNLKKTDDYLNDKKCTKINDDDDLVKEDRKILGLNKLNEKKIKEIKIIPFEKSTEEELSVGSESPFAGDSTKQKSQKELDQIKKDKYKLFEQAKNKIDGLNNLKRIDLARNGNDKKNMVKKIKKKIEEKELIKDSDDLSPLVDKMKNEMRHLKPIEFKPLQTVYMKERPKQDEVSELRITTIPKKTGSSDSSSLRSEKLFKRNLNLIDKDMIKDKSDLPICLNRLNELNELKDDNQFEMKNQESPKVNLNKILNLKDKQLNEKSNKRLNVTSIDKQPTTERYNKLQNFEQIGKMDNLQDRKQNKLVSIDKQDNQLYSGTGKKSKIPLLNDKIKKAKSLTLHKKGLFMKNRYNREDKVDKDLERMFNLKFKK